MQVPYLSDKRTSQITTNQSELDDEVAWGSKKVTCAKVGISLMVQTTVWRWRRWVLHLVHRGCPELQKFVTATNATKNDYQIEHTNEMGRDGLQNDRGTTHEGEVHPISKRVWIPLCEGFTNLQNNTSKKRLHLKFRLVRGEVGSFGRASGSKPSPHRVDHPQTCTSNQNSVRTHPLPPLPSLILLRLLSNVIIRSRAKNSTKKNKRPTKAASLVRRRPTAQVRDVTWSRSRSRAVSATVPPKSIMRLIQPDVRGF